jgi:hypothetical protein
MFFPASIPTVLSWPNRGQVGIHKRFAVFAWVVELAQAVMATNGIQINGHFAVPAMPWMCRSLRFNQQNQMTNNWQEQTNRHTKQRDSLSLA